MIFEPSRIHYGDSEKKRGKDDIEKSREKKEERNKFE